MTTALFHPITPPARIPPPGSPYSGYYSDSSPLSAAPLQKKSRTQSALLDRLSQLAVQIAREDPIASVAHHVQRALDNLYSLLVVPGPAPVPSASLSDSGLFVEDDEEEEVAKTVAADEHAPVPSKAESDDEIEDVYNTMIKMSMELHNGFLDMQSKQEYQASLEANLKQVQAQNNALKTENETLQSRVAQARFDLTMQQARNQSLRTDLGNDFSEIMSLKLQLMSAEVRATLHLAPARSERRARLLRDMQLRWTDEWHVMDERFVRASFAPGSVDPRLLDEAHQLAAGIEGIRCHGDPALPVIDEDADDDDDDVDAEADEPARVDDQDNVDHEPAHAEDADKDDDAVAHDDNHHHHHVAEPTPGLLARLWRSTAQRLTVPKSFFVNADPRKGIWDTLADVTGVAMYDDFYDEYAADAE